MVSVKFNGESILSEWLASNAPSAHNLAAHAEVSAGSFCCWKLVGMHVDDHGRLEQVLLLVAQM